MTEPTITVQNLGGSGGETYEMLDNASGANWKFKATLSGGFKIRDHAHSIDVIVIEQNSFANAIYINSDNNIGIGTALPDQSALLDLSSTTKGFLAPRLTSSQIQGIANPANSLLAYCTTDNKYYSYLSNEGVWKEILFGTITLSPSETCGPLMYKIHTAGTVAPVDKSVTIVLPLLIKQAQISAGLFRTWALINRPSHQLMRTRLQRAGIGSSIASRDTNMMG